MARDNRRLKHSRSRSRSRERKRRSPNRSRRPNRSQSRSRDRKRSRSRERRDRDKGREKARYRKRSRSKSTSKDKKREKRSKSKSRSKSRSRSPVKHREGELRVKEEPIDKEEEQRRLELEMQKRRERIEQWRSERKKAKELVLPLNIVPAKKWTLDDDADSDEEEGTNKKDNGTDNDPADPFESYMRTISDEVKTSREMDKKKMGQSGETLFDNSGASSVAESDRYAVITAVAKSKEDPSKQKGELMESNIDAMEYSSEEEVEDLDFTLLNMVKKRKELTLVDHTRIYYAPFRKNFYVEVPELSKMTQEDVDEYRVELEHLTVRGKNCPKPIKTWPHCGISKKILDTLKRQDYEKPTPIQAQAIPAVMSGRDLIGIAKTGSGKTLAFLLPMFRHIADQPPLEENDGPIAMIQTPTRELAMQIAAECKKFTKYYGITAVCVYGGTGVSEQIAELKRGCEIVVCTPGRMIDMLAANNDAVCNLVSSSESGDSSGVKAHLKASSHLAVAEHTDNTGHIISATTASIINIESNVFKQKVKIIEIFKHKPTMNRDEGYRISVVFQSML